jgi:hypothetical protein
MTCGAPGPTRSTAPSGFLAAAQDEIARREYEATRNPLGLQAPNRAHDLQTYFDESGIRLHDAAAPGNHEMLRLSLARIGRDDRFTAVGSGDEVEARGERVEIRRPGIVEWYVNSAAGLEQGFTISERPAGVGPLVVELSLAGGRASLEDDSILLRAADRVLHYDQLAVLDAEGRALEARFVVPDENRLQIVVADGGARYPVAIDPMIRTSPDAVITSNQSQAFLSQVAGAGDVNGDGYDDVIVGTAYYSTGSAYGAAFIFRGCERTPSCPNGVAAGGPSAAATRLFGDEDISSGFGGSVAAAGDVNGDGYADVIVSAAQYGPGDYGAAFLYLGSASGIPHGGPSTATSRISGTNGYLLYFARGAGDVNGDGYDDVIASGYALGSYATYLFLGSASGIRTPRPRRRRRD